MKATKWQLNFFIALMTSWTSFEIFYSKQFNKRMLDQYIQRFFPRITTKGIKTVDHLNKKSESELKKQDNNRDLRSLMDYLRTTSIQSTPRPMVYDCRICIKGITLKKAIAKVWQEQRYANYVRQGNVNNILKISYDILCIDSDDIYTKDSFKISVDAKNALSQLYNKMLANRQIIITRVELYPARVGQEDIHKMLLYVFDKYIAFENATVSKHRGLTVKSQSQIVKTINHKYMNIGLEFEYDIDGNETMSEDLLKTFDDRNLISISSGYDNKADDEDIYDLKYTEATRCIPQSNTRLNEDRLRLNGIMGLKSLYKYLIYLNTNGKISNSSSVHIHIDCLYDKSFDLVQKDSIWCNSTSSLYKYFSRVKQPSLLNLIYTTEKEKIKNEKGYLKPTDGIRNLVRGMGLRNNLRTLEFRSFKTSFQYEDIVMYILVASYITRCTKRGLKIEEELIKTIIKANGIVKKNKSESLTHL